MLLPLIFVGLLLAIVLEWVLTLVQFKLSGIPFKIGIPLMHNVARLLMHLDTIFDEQVEDMEAQGERGPWMVVQKRGMFTAPLIFSGNVEVNKYILSGKASVGYGIELVLLNTGFRSIFSFKSVQILSFLFVSILGFVPTFLNLTCGASLLRQF